MAGILVVVAIGVALGVFCGGLLLACVVVYMKRYRRHHVTHYQRQPRLHTHTHTPIERTFVQDYPGEPVPERQTNLDFTEARDSEWQWHQLDHMQVCTSLQTDNHASTPLLSFYRPDALPAAQPTASKH